MSNVVRMFTRLPHAQSLDFRVIQTSLLAGKITVIGFDYKFSLYTTELYTSRL